MSSDRPSKDSTQHRLFVEGADDFHVVCALVRQSSVVWTSRNPAIPYAPDTNGDANAIKKAVIAVKSLHPRVGLVIDADSDPDRRWSDIRRKFDTVGISLPERYVSDGVVLPHSERRLGIWMMPHGGRPGAVETLVASLVPQSSDKLKAHADASTAKARECGAAFADKDLEKARLRTWLAWQKAPGAPYGRAIDAGFLAPSSAEADDLVRWFKALYLD